jgi:GDPmannose 4,6-dehydratase
VVAHLLRRGYEVVGVSRQARQRHCAASVFEYMPLDLRRADRLVDLLERTRPSLIFHFAAVHGEAGTRYEPVWQDMLAVNVGATHACLEYLRTRCSRGGLVYAGSGKIFGPVYPPVVSEESPVRSSCLYTVTKNASRELIECYRREHGIRASVLHLFNHESARRGASFFIPTLASALYRAMADPRSCVEIDTLQFHCDWGSAEEYADIAVDVAEKALGTDLIIATGRTWLAADLARELFERRGLDYRNHLIERGRPASPAQLFKVAVGRLAECLGRVPTVGAIEVCDNILAGLQMSHANGERP